MSGEFTLARVTFPDGPKQYTYRTDLPGLRKGDTLVVRTGRGLAFVTYYGPAAPTPAAVERATAWVVDKVDFSGEDARRHAEQKAAEESALEDLI